MINLYLNEIEIFTFINNESLRGDSLKLNHVVLCVTFESSIPHTQRYITSFEMHVKEMPPCMDIFTNTFQLMATDSTPIQNHRQKQPKL